MRLRNIPGAKDAIESSPYVIHEPAQNKGRWNEIFKNNHPIYIEVGMGKGRFLMDLASQNPDINYIGFEMYDSVLLRALQKWKNVPKMETLFQMFTLSAWTQENFHSFLIAGEVDKIYLNFSDPWPKERHAKRRLTSRQFLERYDAILKSDGVIEFKTDNRPLFDFSLEEVNESKWHLVEWTYDSITTKK